MARRVYLDWNATAPLRPEARAAMLEAMEVVGNPSSVHTEGRAAKALLERARDQVAGAVGCRPGEVVFTSGATEAAGVLRALGGDGDKCATGAQGVLVQDMAHEALRAHATPGGGGSGGARVLAMGLADGETGIITQPPDRIDGQWPCGPARADLLCLDVTQAVGRIPFSFAWSGADMAILSAHKLGGPKGTGALILRHGVEIPALARGGGQETGRRSGTENIIGIMGFGAAAAASQRDLEAGDRARVEKLRNILEKALEESAKDIIFIGRNANRLPNTSCFAVPGWKGETQVMQMDLAGFAVSAGSACSSGKARPSRVLQAMGHDDRTAASAIRVSLGPTTTEDELLRFATAWIAAHGKHKARARPE